MHVCAFILIASWALSQKEAEKNHFLMTHHRSGAGAQEGPTRAALPCNLTQEQPAVGWGAASFESQAGAGGPMAQVAPSAGWQVKFLVLFGSSMRGLLCRAARESSLVSDPRDVGRSHNTKPLKTPL